MASPNTGELTEKVKIWGRELGFQQVGITDTDLSTHEARLDDWLAKGFQADMHYMSMHGIKRSQPAALVPGTIRIISARMDYLPDNDNLRATLADHDQACIARFALGRDYHKVIRARLRKLQSTINTYLLEHNLPGFAARVFTDSAPVLEKGIAEKSGLGWIGKNTLLLNESAGSWFFLGEIYTNIPFQMESSPATNRCGSCQACIDICPTKAIVAPWRLDAKRCISYHTIENKGVIPVSVREKMGNRIFGCDDCQMVCPWNRYATPTAEPDFKPRHNLNTASLLSLFQWSKQEFDEKSAGSAIRRAGYEGWLRNISIALGNANYKPNIVAALQQRLEAASPMLREHLQWAIERQQAKSTQS